MKFRAVAAAALAVALGAGLTGCNMISPQRTNMEYDASDGVSASLGSGVSVQNALLITDDEGAAANLVFSAVNLTTDDVDLAVDVAGETVSIPLAYTPGEGLNKIGFGEGGQQLVEGDFVSGTTVEVAFSATYTDAEGASQSSEETILVPVLGADDPERVLEEYAHLLPVIPVETTPEPTTDFEGGLEGDAAAEGETGVEGDASAEGGPVEEEFVENPEEGGVDGTENFDEGAEQPVE
ncbi:hypothetical protein FM112_16635 [Gulosibacter sp. 10]|nr:hypothetical protein FM112_16635 [Gulosibacter sp. 10]